MFGSGNDNSKCKRGDSIYKLEQLETRVDEFRQLRWDWNKQQAPHWHRNRAGNMTKCREAWQERDWAATWKSATTVLVGHEVEGGMCTLYRNSRRLWVSIWKREKTKPVIHSFWFIFQQSLKITHRCWVLAAQGTPVRSWRLSGAKTTPGNKPGEDKHKGLMQSYPGEPISKDGDKDRTPGTNRHLSVWSERQVEDHPLLGSCKQINQQGTLQYLSLSVHDQT